MRAIILKLDDLARKSKRWESVTQYIIDQKLKASIGIIGKSLQGDSKIYFDWIKQLNGTGRFEFWNHGFTHEKSESKFEFFDATYEDQFKSLLLTQFLGKEKLGIEFRTFGEPFNKMDKNTELVLQKIPEIKVWLMRKGVQYECKLCLGFYRENCDIFQNGKFPHFLLNFEKIKKFLEKTKNEEYVVFQFHPNGWNEESIWEFHKLISYLKSDSTNVFMTPYEYWKSKQTAV